MVTQLNEEQISRLKTQAEKYGGVGSDAFKVAVDKQYGAGSYDKITKNVARSIQSGAIQGDKAAAEKVLAQPAQSFAMNTQELAARNKARDVAFKETTPNPTGLAVNNTPSPTATTPPPTPTVNAEPVTPPPAATTAEEAQNNVTTTIQQNIDAATKAEEERKKQQEARILEDQKLKEQQMKEAEDAATKREELIKKSSEDVAAIEAENFRLAEERKARDVEEMKRTQATEREAMNAANELEKWKNEQAIKEQEKAIEVQKLRSAWAFNKMGAGFTSAAIAQADKLATEGATAIAGLKLQANANEAASRREVSKLEFDFARNINATIDKYTDIQMSIKENAINRINNTTNNLLLSEEQKRKEKNAVMEKYKNDIRNTEDEMYVEFERNRDKALERARQLEQEMRQKETDAINKAKLSVASGDWARTTPDKRREAERSMGLPPGTLDTEMHSQINQLITNAVDSVLGKGYPLGNREYIVSQVIGEMKNGRNLESAALYVLERELRNNPDYIRAKEQASLSSTAETLKTQEYISSLGYSNVIDNVEVGNIVDYSTKKRGRTNLQCGELVNDYWTQITGSKAGMGDTLISKKNAIRKIGESDGPIVGGLMVSNPLNNSVGHTGIVQKVNEDGSVVILEANAAGKKEGQPPVLKTYTAEQIKGMMFSVPPKGSTYNKSTTASGTKNNEWYILNVPGFDKMSPEKQKQIKGMSDEGLATYIENNTKKTDEDLTKAEKEILNAGNFISTIASGEGSFSSKNIKNDAKTVGQNISSMIENGYTVDDITSFLSGFTNEEKSMYYKNGKVYFKEEFGKDNGYTIQELIRLTQKK